MTISLKHNKISVCDINIKKEPGGSLCTDVESSISIKLYSDILLGADNSRAQEEVIHDFEIIQDLKSWYWEYYKEMVNEEPTVAEVLSAIKETIEPIAKRYELGVFVN